MNNAYLIASRHPLARLYNDNSVLENSHISAMYNILAALPELDIFAGLGPDGWRDARKLVIHAILHTDMTYHFPLVSQVSSLRKGEARCSGMLLRAACPHPMRMAVACKVAWTVLCTACMRCCHARGSVQAASNRMLW